MKFFLPCGARIQLLGILVLTASAAACGDSLNKEPQLEAAMKAALSQLAVAEEQIFADSGTYTIDESIVQTDPSVFLSVQFATPNGWGAEANHVESRSHCAMFIGAGELSFQGRWSGIVPGEAICKPIPTGSKK